MSAPRVTIGLAMRDSARTIDAAIGSILAQTVSDWELIVFDDGSRDESVDRVSARADDRVRLVVDGRGKGLASRMNEAVNLARGQYFARMDADDIAYPERLARQLEFLQNDPAVDLVGAGMMIFRDDGSPVGLHPVRTTHEAICERPWRGFHLPHPTWCGRTEWFRRWRYDPSFRKAQDQDLLRRAWRTSRFAAIPEPLVGYRQDRLSIGKSWRSRYHVARSLLAAGRRDREFGAALGGTVAQVGMAAVDAFAIASGLERRVLRHRVRPASPEQIARWTEVWAAREREAACAA